MTQKEFWVESPNELIKQKRPRIPSRHLRAIEAQLELEHIKAELERLTIEPTTIDICDYCHRRAEVVYSRNLRFVGDYLKICAVCRAKLVADIVRNAEDRFLYVNHFNGYVDITEEELKQIKKLIPNNRAPRSYRRAFLRALKHFCPETYLMLELEKRGYLSLNV